MEVTVRPARRSDRAPLMEFIKNVWGGHDYIPRVWDQWLSDTKNLMFVVEVDGTPVGMNRVRFLEDGSAWFEGARVHPKYRRQGLGSMLGDNSMKVSRERGISTYRLTSGSRNHTAHRQIARIKFKEVSRFSIYEPSRLPRKAAVVATVPKGKDGEALELMRSSLEYRLGHGVFWHDWGAAALNPAVVRKLVEEGAVKRLGGALVVLRKGGGGRRPWAEVGFVGGRADDAAILVKSVLSSAKGAQGFVFVPQGSPIITELRRSGFRRRFSNVLFERRAAKG
jgi:GNAT superfamily N-acetyltransferase